MTISEVETSASELFELLRNLPLTPEMTQTRDYLFPKGMTPVVELYKDGRKAKRNAASWNWPSADGDEVTGEIRIYLEPDTLPTDPDPIKTEGIPVENTPALAAHATYDQGLDPVTPEEIVECCQALASAEKSNRQFIALKWFRDAFLPTVDFTWARSDHRRQRVLSQAIDMGRIDTKKISNPKSEFPTMTVSLNRSIPIPGVAPRFQPIVVRGEPVSTTLLRDRGSI